MRFLSPISYTATVIVSFLNAKKKGNKRRQFFRFVCPGGIYKPYCYATEQRFIFGKSFTFSLSNFGVIHYHSIGVHTLPVGKPKKLKLVHKIGWFFQIQTNHIITVSVFDNI